MKEIKACIFDLDGVIVDTAHFHFKAWKRLADELGIPFNQKDNERLKGVSRRRSLEIILELGGKKVNEEHQKKLRDRKNNWYREYISDMTPDDILPGVMDFMQQVKNYKIKVGLATASKNGKTILERIGLIDFFHAIVDGNLITKAKPDPQVFLTCADMMHVPPVFNVVFEDAIAGIKAARNGSMGCIGVGNKETLKNADHVIESFQGFSLKDLFKIYNLSYTTKLEK